MRHGLLSTLGIAPALLLSGCLTTVGPDYAAPELDAGQTYQGAQPKADAARPAQVWWTAFDDPVLARLIETGLSDNLDLQLADSLVREAEATLASTGAARAPTLDGTASATTTADRKYNAPPASADNKMDPRTDTAVGVVFSWAADLFGGLKRAEEAARADAERQAWLRRDTALSVAANIARTYVTLRGAEQRLALTQESLDLQRRTTDIVRSRVNAGLSPGLDLSRAEASVQSLEADLRPIETEIRQARDSIATLLGRRPGELGELLPEGDAITAAAAVPAISATPVLGLPADLLRRRPDLRAAERDLQRATASIGVAESALYPSLTIPARFQVTTASFGAADIVHTLLASLSATLDIPLLDGGARRADLTVAQEQARQALITYRAALLTALSEVEAALHAHAGAQRRLAALDLGVAADERAFEQANTLYVQGLTSFLDILDAQRTMTTARLRQVATQTDLATTAIDLFQAAGFAPEPFVAQ